MAQPKRVEAQKLETVGGIEDVAEEVRKSEAEEVSKDEANDLEHVELTEEDNKRIRRKTDKVILTILVWVYFLQILDKSMLGYGAVFGLAADTHLTGNQYSILGSIAPVAMVVWQPFSSWLIVRVPHRLLMPALCLGWGIAQACMAACNNFAGLLATRFFLGLFEAGCLPLFSVITSEWYRRAEQPLRVAAWYSTNGVATIVGAALSYGLGQIHSSVLRSWQIIFLFVGLLTIASVPFAYWRLDNDIPSARFLTPLEKKQATKRLLANQTGTSTRRFDGAHVVELTLEPKTYLWLGMSLLLNIGAAVTNTFGPLILQGIGFDKYIASLLTMPFGAIQLLVILLGSWGAQRARVKSAFLAALMLPVLAGLAVLYALPRNGDGAGGAPLVVAYYLLAFLFGGNTLIIAWIVGNTGGTTKKAVVMSLYMGALAIGNIIGPLLFAARDAPSYLPGLRKTLAVFSVLIAVVGLQFLNLVWLNRRNRARRVKAGKKAEVTDYSMRSKYVEAEASASGAREEEGGTLAARQEPAAAANLDLTDGKNDEFVYIY